MVKPKAQKGREIASADEELATAMESFSLSYGQDESKLDKWQLLCEDCGVTRGTSITKCKAVIKPP